MTNSGKRKRLSRIFRANGRTVIVPMDHGVTNGPISGLANMQLIVDKLLEGEVDAVVLHKGIAKCVDSGRIGLIVHLSGSTKWSPDPNRKVQVASVEEAERIGADAVSVHINVGSETESEMLDMLGRVADECDNLGMPLLAMMYPRGKEIKNEHAPDLLAHVARLGAELGADVIKTNYTGEIDSFREVIRGCPVPVVIAGGPKAKETEDVFEMIAGSLIAGGAGVSIGRNVFQAENPTAMARAISHLVHKGSSVAGALAMVR